jgi:hypothetical protein
MAVEMPAPLTSSQRRLGPQWVKNTAPFAPWGPSLRWGDGYPPRSSPTAASRSIR